MATFKQRDSGWWQAQIRRKGFPEQSRTFEKKVDAEAWARSIENEMDRGMFVPREEAERTTLFDALGRYLREVTPKKRGAEQEEYRVLAWQRDPLALRTLAALKSSDFAAWRDARIKEGFAASTIRKNLGIISNLFNVAAKEWGLAVLNPMAMVKLPPEDNARERVFVGDEEMRIFAAIDNPGTGTMSKKGDRRNIWLRPAVVFALETAARQSEVVSLVWPDVDLKRCVARIRGIDGRATKNDDKFRDVPLSSRAVAMLDALPRSLRGKVFLTTESSIKQSWTRAVSRARDVYERETLFAGLRAAGLEEDEALAEIRKVRPTPGPKKAKPTPARKETIQIVEQLAEDPLLIDLHFHDLRHVATSRLAEKITMQKLMKVTGHKDTRMLARYYHPRAEDIAKELG